MDGRMWFPHKTFLFYYVRNSWNGLAVTKYLSETLNVDVFQIQRVIIFRLSVNHVILRFTEHRIWTRYSVIQIGLKPANSMLLIIIIIIIIIKPKFLAKITLNVLFIHSYPFLALFPSIFGWRATLPIAHPRSYSVITSHCHVTRSWGTS
jgi:hypothetical protein